MKIALLGGTGRTGRFVIDEGISRGHEVIALVRTTDKITVTSERLRIVQGTPLDLETVKSIIQGADAVLVALNINRSSDLPWAKVTSPKDLISQSVKNTIDAMVDFNVKRIVTISAYGAGETKAKIGWLGRLFLYGTNIKYAYLDHERQEQLLMASDLDWTILRPTFLTSKQGPKEVIASIDGVPKPKGTIARKNLARFMLDCAEKGLHIRQAVTVSEK